MAARPLGPVWDMAFDEPALLESLESGTKAADIRLAKVQADYKREQLAKLYGNRPKRNQGEESVADKRPLRLALRARFPVLNR